MSTQTDHDHALSTRAAGVTPPAAVIVLALLVILAIVGATRLPGLIFPGPQDPSSVTTRVIGEHSH